MNVLVSDTTTNYNNWVVVRKLRDVLDIVGNVDNLVYHKSKESSEDKIAYLSNIYKNMTSCKIVYICNKDKVDNAIRMLVVGGLNGKYIDDEFFLESERELNTLVSDLSVIVENTELSSSAVLQDFFNRYVESGGNSIPKGYLQVVKNAVIEITEAYHAKSLEILNMSESASEIFSNSIDIISQMREHQAALEKDLSTLKKAKEDIDALTMRPIVGSSIVFYPKVSYLKNKAIIRVKDLGRCMYLTSFMLGFREYLEKIKNVRPKLIIIEGTGKFLEDRYSNYLWVTSVNKNDIRNYNGNVVFTNYPTSLVLNKLLDDTNYDTFVVVDRTFNYKEHILNCRGLEVKAISGASMIQQNKLVKNKCISSVVPIDGTMLSIPLLENYPDRDDQRVNRYLKDCSTLFELLYSSKDK